MSRCFFSVDLEDWFHAHNLRPVIDREDWDECELRVVDNTKTLLDLLDRHDVTATFFVLGYVADRAPDLIREVEARGHEIATHGYNHKEVTDLSRAEFSADVERSIESIEAAIDGDVHGYRAPSFSITGWALDVLRELGLTYDSSSFPFAGHPRYGNIDVQQEGTFVRLDNGLVEAQLPLLSIARKQIPWAGGGYFRFIPYTIYQRGIQRIQKRQDVIFYVHPWELDPDQPSLPGLSPLRKVRHYRNLDETVHRLDRLLDAFEWEPIGAKANEL